MERERSRLAVARTFFLTLLLVWAIDLFVEVNAQTSTVGRLLHPTIASRRLELYKAGPW
jgi:hypothetical protein